ncbi:MAG: glycosyltransferase family 4 protein [Planctomycetes bacterium]|nr:glycosyltransferase family 4 protein [Planctomycetota bacterium]
MKVLHVIPSIAPAQGGLSTAVIGTCRAMLAAGMAPEIACFEGEADLPVHRFRRGLRVLGASREMHDWLLAHAGDYQVIVAHVVWLNPAHYAAQAAAKAGVPLYLASHGMLDPDALAHHRLRKLIRWHLGARELARESTLVFSSEADRARSLSHPELKSARAVVVPNPVEPIEPHDQPGPPLIVCLNRLHPRKGVREWVSALLALKAEGLVFRAVHAGPVEDAAYAANLMQAAAGLVEFRGVIDNAAAREMIASAQIVVHPAVGFENFGNVIAEGMAAGRAVVASRRALVTPELEVAGVVLGVEPTIDQLADAMRRLLQDGDTRVELGRKARGYAAEHLSLEAVGKRWRDILFVGVGTRHAHGRE